MIPAQNFILFLHASSWTTSLVGGERGRSAFGDFAAWVGDVLWLPRVWGVRDRKVVGIVENTAQSRPTS